MAPIQPFCLLGEKEIKIIPCENIYDQNVIYWEDIERVFPGVKYIQMKGVIVSYLRGLDRVRIVPHCIKHEPSVVLDVVLSGPEEKSHGTGATSTVKSSSNQPTTAAITNMSSLLLLSSSSSSSSSSKLSPTQVDIMARRKTYEFEIEKLLLGCLPSVSTDCGSVSQAIKELRKKPFVQVDQNKQLCQLTNLATSCYHGLKEELEAITALLIRIDKMEDEIKALHQQLHQGRGEGGQSQGSQGQGDQGHTTSLQRRIRTLLDRHCLWLNDEGGLIPRLLQGVQVQGSQAQGSQAQ
ncbi:hypothetical protein BGX31_011630, partial [Mortierella sp. GBA43]